MIGVPYVIGESLVDGGRPESVEEKDLSVLKESRLYFVEQVSHSIRCLQNIASHW
jgi:hypothetical protein